MSLPSSRAVSERIGGACSRKRPKGPRARSKLKYGLQTGEEVFSVDILSVGGCVDKRKLDDAQQQP
jgi:hypothetical protein